MSAKAALRGQFSKLTEGNIFHHKALRNVLFVPGERLIVCYADVSPQAMPTPTGMLSVTYARAELIAGAIGAFRLKTPSSGTFVFQAVGAADPGAEARAWVAAISTASYPNMPGSSVENSVMALRVELDMVAQQLEAANKATHASQVIMALVALVVDR
jgi:hypothetical protein